MIYITGDTHIPVDIGKLSTKNFPEQKEMTKDDYVIICGDFGGVWDNSNEEHYWIKWLKNKSFTTLFIDGNHENFEMLNSLPETEFAGATVHKINDSIYHLKRGNVYLLDGKRFYVFGGGKSHDREYRTEGKNWWKEEMPSQAEYSCAEENLKANNYEVDYVLTHCASSDIQRLVNSIHSSDELTDFHERVRGKIKYKKWFFGHYHKDIKIDEKHIAVFNSVIKISQE